MELRVRFLAASLLCVATLMASGADASGQGLEYLPGFPAELPPRQLPDAARYLNLAHPMVYSFRGMDEGILLGWQSHEDTAGVVLRVKEVVNPITKKKYVPDAEASPDKPVGCELLLVSRNSRSLGRPGYLSSLVQRCPGLVEGNVASVPELLVHDLQAFKKGASTFVPGDEPPIGKPGPAKTGPMVPTDACYFLLRYRVHPQAPEGMYDICLDVTAEALSAEAACIRLIVVKATLPRTEKHLCLSAEFEEQHHLRALADAGLTFMRVRSASRWPDRDARFRELASWGVKGLSQNIPPQSEAEVGGLPATPVVYFYGIDEPQPKRGRAGREGWDRMAEHIRKSNSIHAMGGKVGTSLPFQLAESLADRSGGVYQMTAALGAKGMYEPLDWSNYGSGLPRMLNPRNRRTQTLPGIGVTVDLHTYLDERRAGRQKKRDRLETCYFPLGLMRDPFYARYMFGVFAAESGLDGIFAWTAMRPQGNIFDDSDGVDALVALPSSTGIAATYCFEAMRAGMNDLRIIEFLRSKKDGQVDALLVPWRSILVDEKPLDTVLGEAGLAKLRRDLMQRVLCHAKE